MSLHDHRQFEQALAGIDRAVLPSLALLLDSVLESAALARPGIDAGAHGDSLRRTAVQVNGLAALIGAVTQGPTIRA